MTAILLARGAWTPVRAELERILLDDEWHMVPRVVAQIAPFVDPRVAARQWYRQHRMSRAQEEKGELITERFRADERKALAWGARAVSEQVIRTLVISGRLEVRGQRKHAKYFAWRDAEVRISPASRKIEVEADLFCFHRHPRPAEGWPKGERHNCALCSRERHARTAERNRQLRGAAAD